MIVVTAVAYHNTFQCRFIFDDRSNIEDNPKIRRLWPLWDVMWSPIETGVAGRPVVQLSFALNYAVGGLDVRGYHAANLLLHAGTALLLLGVLRRTLRSPRLSGSFGHAADPLALAVTLAWALHPILTNSVTYVSSRTELLAGFFVMLTLYVSIRAMRASTPAARAAYSAAAIVSCAVGTGCKEIMVAVPVLVLLYDWVFVSESLRQAFRERAGLYAGLFAAVLILTPFNLYMADFHRSALVTRWHLSPWDYLKIQAGVLLHYLRLSVWPDELAIDYQGWAVPRTLAQVWPAGLVIVLLLGVTAYALLRRRSAAGYAGAWCFVVLAPTSSLLPLPTEVATERRVYLPLMGLVALIIVGGYRLLAATAERVGLGRRHLGYAAFAIIAVVVAAELNRTLARNEDYNNPIALWADNARQQPNNERAWDNLGREFLAEQNYNAARECYLKSLALDPGNFRALNNLGSLALREGNKEEASRYLRAAIAVRPDAAAARANLALIHRKRGELDEAERLVRDAIKLQAAGPAPHLVLADVLSARRQFAAAEESARAALAMDPGSATARVTLGTALAGRGRDAEAVAAFRDAFRLGPSPETRLHLAWQLAAADDASVRNSKEAIELASRAADDTGRTDSYSLDVLALAFAADGRFADAVETATRAHELAKAKQLPRAALIDARRKAYATGAMPNRELRDFGH